MYNLKRKRIVVILLFPLIAATVVCCCFTGKAHAQDIVYQVVESAHDCCEKAKKEQSETDRHHQKECSCNIAAIERFESDSQAIVHYKVDAFNTIVVASLGIAQQKVFFPRRLSSKTSGSSPPIYIRVAHLLI